MQTLLMAFLFLPASPAVVDNEFLQAYKNSAPCAAGGPICGDRIIVALGPIEMGGQKMVRGDFKVFKTGVSYSPPKGGDYVEVAMKPDRPQAKMASVAIFSNLNRVLYEGDRYAVVEENFQPGEMSIRHSHPQRLSIMLNATRNQSWADGQTEPGPPRDLVPDSIGFGQPVIHTVKNLGPNPLRNIMIELKP